jgi:hypothetical protein
MEEVLVELAEVELVEMVVLEWQTAGQPGTGGGGGAGGQAQSGAGGGGGIIILRASPTDKFSVAPGSNTVTTTPTYKLATFNVSGTLTVGKD